MMDGNHPHAGMAPSSLVHVHPGGARADGAGEPVPPGPRRRYAPRKQAPPERLPLDEAAKREMENLPLKTPVSVLQELLARRGTVPKYELVQIEGMIHEPTFRYRVTVADLVAMGTGRSKKEAKHSAAKCLLDKLTGVIPADQQTTNGTGTENITTVPSQNSTYEDKLLGNPVGWLQELCMSRLWPPPAYTTDPDDSNGRRLPHERQFTVVCALLKRREVGSGKSKKLAKRQAAYKMWQALQDNPPEAFHAGDEEGAVSAHYADLKDSKISTLTTSHSHKVSNFHKHLKANIGPKLAKLQATPLNNKEFNYVQYLQEIAAEQSFEVTFVDIEERSAKGRWQCLVQLSTLPVAVCYGAGGASRDAQAAAAHNALEYLKIMTKK